MHVHVHVGARPLLVAHVVERRPGAEADEPVADHGALDLVVVVVVVVVAVVVVPTVVVVLIAVVTNRQ